jgi:hypothetical protein
MRWLTGLACIGVWLWCGAAPAAEEVLLVLSVDGDRLQVKSGAEPGESWEASFAEARVTDGRYHVGDAIEVGGDTLYLAGRAFPFQRFGELGVTRENGRVTVQIYDRGVSTPPPSRASNVLGASEPLTIDSGRFVRGGVLSFGGRIEVAGEVNRSVVCVGGDVSLQPGAVVRGSVVAFGGDVHKPEEAFVYGDLYADNRQKFQPRWYEDSRQEPVEFSVSLDYHRVAGGLAWAGIVAGPKRGYAPRLSVEAGYAFGAELWHYRIGLGRDQFSGPLYYLGFHRDTKDDDARLIGRHENTLFALLFGLDYRDYYFAQGFRAQTGWAFAEHRRVSLAYVNETLTALDANREQWSLFNGGDFQRNYETLWRTGDTTFLADFAGRLVFLKGELSMRWPEYVDREEGSWTLSADLEASSPDLGSDFDYTRYGGRIVRVQPTWEHQELRARLSADAAGGGLPATRYLYLGGIGDLRGFDQKEFFGDRRWFLNVEYGWQWKTFEVFALYDAGQVTRGMAWDGRPILHDVGLGVQIQNTFRAQLAADARFERDPLVTVRFTRPF